MSLIAATGQVRVLAWRGLLRIKHDPQSLFDVVVLPVVAIVLFAGVFGGAIAGDVEAYLPMLVPGVLTQVVLTASVMAGVQLRDDMDSGVIDRHLTLPVARVAPLGGALLANVVRYVVALAMGVTTGLAMGYRPESWPGLAAACAVIAWCAFALSWVFAAIGATARSASAVQGMSMLLLTLLSFTSNALVPLETMPGWMRAVAEVNPISLVVTAARDLAGAEPANGSVVTARAAALAVLVVAVPLAVKAQGRRG